MRETNFDAQSAPYRPRGRQAETRFVANLLRRRFVLLVRLHRFRGMVGRSGRRHDIRLWRGWRVADRRSAARRLGRPDWGRGCRTAMVVAGWRYNCRGSAPATRSARARRDYLGRRNLVVHSVMDSSVGRAWAI